MKRVIILIIALLMLGVLLTLAFSTNQDTLRFDALAVDEAGLTLREKNLTRNDTTKGVLNETPLSPTLRCLYYDEQSFKNSYSRKNSIYEAQVKIILEGQTQSSEMPTLLGGILPHHLVAAPMIARFFTATKEEFLQKQPSREENSNTLYPETIIILAPNHERVGDRPLHTGAFTWDTPFGQLEANEEIVQGLIKTFGAGVNLALLEEEHSISALIPYIRYTFPEARIVPILIHGNMKRADCRALSQFLAKKAEDNPCLILASIDFSHGLKSQESLQRDEIIKRVIEARDYDTLLRLDNTYLDAPPTLATFLLTMDLLGKGKQNNDAKNEEQWDRPFSKAFLLERGEASQFLMHHVPDTTSYMTWIFESGDGSCDSF